MAVLNEYLNYIDKIIQKTIEGKIAWNKNTPTTFIWQTIGSRNEKTQITIQRLAQISTKNYYYIFSIMLLGTRETLVNLSATESDDISLFNKLSELYNVVDAKIQKQGLDVFESILKDL
jgi:hypothetical protein